MGERTDIAGLIERLETATGPSKSLSRDIQCRVGGWYRRTPSEGRTRHPTFIHPDDCRDGKPVYDSLHGTDIWREPPDVTASLDAAMALVERVRPGWKWERQWEPGGEFIRLLAPDYHRWTFKGALNRSATGWQSCEAGDAIALCLALLKSPETEQ